MSLLKGCSICCMLLSLWGIIQLALMGLFFELEAVVLIEDAHAHVYDSVEDFMNKTKSNYHAIAVNCWIAAGIYVFITFLTCLCLRRARKVEKIAQANLIDDNVSCRIEDKELSEKAKKKIK